ncbi:PfkB family carbohydrate kinase [Streptomyces fungicidicus]|uniref:PfkB family carbohydrate kinase n=1 Tax=Streptomyces fungicidicus TaxID=68203 RepID=UPI0033F7DA3F
MIVALGGDGVLLLESAAYPHVLAFSVRPWDTTAAGDSFRGALAVALAEGRTLKRSARRACAAAASSTVRPLPGGRARAGRPPAQR